MFGYFADSPHHDPMLSFPLVYSEEDADLARRLGPVPEAEALHLSIDRGNEGPTAAAQLTLTRGPVVLLITPQWLTNPNCLSGLAASLATKRRPIFVLQHDIQLNARPTRQTYVSHWQDRYIDLRRGLEPEEGAQRTALDQYLEKTREISIGIHELLDELADLPTAQFTGAESPASLITFLQSPQQTPAVSSDPADPALGPGEAVDVLTTIKQAWQSFDAGNTDTALRSLRRTVRQDSEDTSVRYQYVLMLALAGHGSAARDELNELLDDDPYHPDGLFLSGELHTEAGSVGAARDDWERLYEIAPNYPRLTERLGSLLATHFAHTEAAYATELLRSGQERGELMAADLFTLGRLQYEQLDRTEEAKQSLFACLAQDSAYAPAYYQLAVMHHEAGQAGQAREHYRRAVKLEPAFATPVNETVFGQQDLAEDAATPSSPMKTTPDATSGTQAAEDPLPTSPAGSKGTVLITGATSGIGRATAYALARVGYRILLTGRRKDRLEDIAQDLTEQGSEVLAVGLDVADRQTTQELLTGLPRDWQRIDVLINNAGKAKGFDPIHSGDLDHWDEMIDVNLRGLLYLTRAISPGMVQRGRGMIINVASTAGKEVYPNGNVYCATKHAVDALTYAMRLDLVKYGIRVGQICPAHVEETEFAVVRFDGDRERARIYEDFQPLRSRDVAEAIVFMVTQPPHVNILDMTLQGTQQASSTVVDRSGRDRFSSNSPA